MAKKRIKNIFKTNIAGAGQEYGLNDKEIEKIASHLAISFQGYPLFEYFAGGKYTLKKMRYFWRTNLLQLAKNSIIISDSDSYSSLAIFSPYEVEKFSLWQHIKNGGITLALLFGPKCIKRMTEFENLALKIKSKYSNPNCWYIYAFVTMPEYRHQGLGGKVFKQMLKIIDERNQDSYLETLLPINVEIYKKYGYGLKESVPVPGTDLTIYAMFRPAQKTDKK